LRHDCPPNTASIIALAISPGRCLDAGDDLGTDALDRLHVETRLGQRQAGEAGGLVAVIAECLQRARERVARGVERKADRVFVERGLKGPAVEVAGALVEQSRQHIGDTRLACGVLRRAALEGEGHGDHGHRVFLDQPRLDALQAHHMLYVHGARAARRAPAGEEEAEGDGRSVDFMDRDAPDQDGFFDGSPTDAGDRSPDVEIFRAAALASTVTASMVEGHACAS
jgi:hypothetical protein